MGCQIGLLKGVVIEMLLILSARHYDLAKDAWHTPKGDVSATILKIATGLNVVYEEHKSYCRDFHEVTSGDPNIIALIQALRLFTPDRPSVDARQTVAGMHDRYSLLLKHYLEAKFGFSGGRAIFGAILMNLRRLEVLTAEYSHLIMQLDTRNLDPLLTEMLNLIPRLRPEPDPQQKGHLSD